MTPEAAYDLLEAISEIHECKDKLVLYKKTRIEEEQEEKTEQILEQHRECNSFLFSYFGIILEKEIEFWSNISTSIVIICKVINDKQIQYNGEIYSLPERVTKLTESKWTV